MNAYPAGTTEDDVNDWVDGHRDYDAMDALETARLAWERSQPQLPLDLYPDALSRADAPPQPGTFPGSHSVRPTEGTGSERPRFTTAPVEPPQGSGLRGTAEHRGTVSLPPEPSTTEGSDRVA